MTRLLRDPEEGLSEHQVPAERFATQCTGLKKSA
jgi:hypothetical protein